MHPPLTSYTHDPFLRCHVFVSFFPLKAKSIIILRSCSHRWFVLWLQLLLTLLRRCYVPPFLFSFLSVGWTGYNFHWTYHLFLPSASFICGRGDMLDTGAGIWAVIRCWHMLHTRGCFFTELLHLSCLISLSPIISRLRHRHFYVLWGICMAQNP
jgi:hypothetical protein